jgi:hypothetical protein
MAIFFIFSLLLKKNVLNRLMKAETKGSKGNSESPWSLHIGSFWKTHFINPRAQSAHYLEGRVTARPLSLPEADQRGPRSDEALPVT